MGQVQERIYTVLFEASNKGQKFLATHFTVCHLQEISLKGNKKAKKAHTAYRNISCLKNYKQTTKVLCICFFRALLLCVWLNLAQWRFYGPKKLASVQSTTTSAKTESRDKKESPRRHTLRRLDCQLRPNIKQLEQGPTQTAC